MTRISFAALTALLLAAVATPVVAQTASSRQAARGVWEPVSYPEDLKLTDVFFVTAEVGWVSGAAGTILHTTDGGTTWTAQLGGDPEAAEDPVERLRFFDERHGWAIKDGKMLATTDGENWEEIAPILHRMGDFHFVSPTDGFAAAGESQYLNQPQFIFRTRDGGRTWEQGPQCEVKAVVDGLTKQVPCNFVRLHFPSATVGYAIGKDTCFGMGCGPPPIMAKTVDGGESWEFFIGPGDVKVAALSDLFFTDEQTGFVVSSEDKLYRTSDGGNTWRGVIATPGDWLGFADPETGWSFAYNRVAFSTDGGSKWTSRRHQFPAAVRAFSFPRRDRAYVVGDHGMVFRYRVLEPGTPAPQGAIAAPAMPPFVSPLEREAAEAVELLEEFEGLEGFGSTSDQSAGSTESGTAGTSSSAGAKTALGKLDLLLVALGKTVPSFLDQFTNLNLLASRLRSTNDLPGRLAELRSALTAVKQAGDKAAAEEALGQAMNAAQGLHASAAVAMQKSLPPEDTDASANDE